MAITYQNEALLGQQREDDFEWVIPPSTILIETLSAVVDAQIGNNAAQFPDIGLFYPGQVSRALSSKCAAGLHAIGPGAHTAGARFCLR